MGQRPHLSRVQHPGHEEEDAVSALRKTIARTPWVGKSLPALNIDITTLNDQWLAETCNVRYIV